MVDTVLSFEGERSHQYRILRAIKNRFGGTDLSGWNLESYQKLGDPIVRDILFRSVWLALLTTVICLVISYPFAYFLTTRSPAVRNRGFLCGWC